MNCLQHDFVPFSAATRDLYCRWCGMLRIDVPLLREEVKPAPKPRRREKQPKMTFAEPESQELPFDDESATLELEITTLMKERGLTLEQALEATADARLTQQMEHAPPEHPNRVPANTEDTGEGLGASNFF